MLKDLLNKIDYYWFLLILTTILCFGYFITNPSMGIDDESLYIYSSFIINVSINRIMQFVFGSIFDIFKYLPEFKELIGIFFYFIAINFNIENYIQYAYNFDKKKAVIFATIATSFPFIILLFMYSEQIITIPIGLFLSAIGVKYTFKYLFDKKDKKYILYTIIFLFIAISIYESCIFYYILSSLFILYTHLVWNKNKFKNEINSILFISFSTISAITINYFLCEILKVILQTNFNKVDEYFKYDISSLKSFMVSFFSLNIEFIREFCSNVIPFTSKTGCNIACTISVFCILIFLVISIIFSIQKKNINISFYSLCMILIPFTPFLISGDVYMPYRIFISLGFINAFTIVIIYSLIKNRPILSKIFLVIVGFIVFNQAKEINQILYTENIKFQNDKIFAHILMYDIEKMNLQDRPIVFVGLKENPYLEHEYHEQAAEINIRTFNWDRYDKTEFELLKQRSYCFIRKQGYNISGIPEKLFIEKYTYKEFEQIVKQNIKNMNIFPKENSIKDVGDFVIVKIGQSKLDLNKNEE